MVTTRYVWDRGKAETNIVKHRVGFDDATFVFDDPDVLTFQDRIEGNEYRYCSIGLVGAVVLLVVAHTWEDDDGDEIVRIISARRAVRKERRLYEDARRERRVD